MKAVRRCTNCGSDQHNRRRCPKPPGEGQCARCHRPAGRGILCEEHADQKKRYNQVYVTRYRTEPPRPTPARSCTHCGATDHDARICPQLVTGWCGWCGDPCRTPFCSMACRREYNADVQAAGGEA